MPDQPAFNLLEYLNSIGTVGLALIVWALWTGQFITRREHAASLAREAKLEAQLEKALSRNDRTLDTNDKLVEKLPAKN